MTNGFIKATTKLRPSQTNIMNDTVYEFNELRVSDSVDCLSTSTSFPLNHEFMSLPCFDDLTICPDSRFRGFHILLDYSEFALQDPLIFSNWTMETILHSLAKNNIRCVHHHSEVFEATQERNGSLPPSPPGFTSVCLLDESHVSAHCYSEKGMLAIDVFTCGGKPNQTYAAAKDIHCKVVEYLESCKFIGSSTFRFPYRIGEVEQQKPQTCYACSQSPP